ncbi:DUF6464 family protein [Scytonema sp. NUACC26]|uniref:DUF6464 family protein n=1 Tax=Scytonema sp. NUACC26 TaxID=3140176 RepID=UPI0034DBA68F
MSTLKTYKEGVEVKTLLVIAIGFLPSLFSLWLMRKSQARTRLYFRRVAMASPGRRIQQERVSGPSDRYYLEGVGYLIGDISCCYNARSGYIRCAVNPEGPCEGCRHYQSNESVSGKDIK